MQNQNQKLVRKNEKVLLSREYRAEISGVDMIVGTLRLTAYELHATKKDGSPSSSSVIEIRSGKRKFVDKIGYVIVDSYISINKERFDDLAKFFTSIKQ